MDSPGGSGSDDPGGGSGGGGSSAPLKKGPWTSAEDNILVAYVQKHGEGNWNNVQKQSGLFRCGKSCRLRWANHLRPNLKKGAFTPEEERLIIELHAKLGNKWARMATQLPGRTDNEIKNYWNTRIKRRQRAGLPVYPPDIQAAINSNKSDNHQQNVNKSLTMSSTHGGGSIFASFKNSTSMVDSLALRESLLNHHHHHHHHHHPHHRRQHGEFHGLTLQALQSTPGLLDPSSSTPPPEFHHHHHQQQQQQDLNHHHRFGCGAVSSDNESSGIGRSHGAFFLNHGPVVGQQQEVHQTVTNPIYAAAGNGGLSFFGTGSSVFNTVSSSCSRPNDEHIRHSDLKLELPSSQLSAAESTSDSPSGSSQISNTMDEHGVHQQQYNAACFWQQQQEIISSPIKLEGTMHLPHGFPHNSSSNELELMDAAAAYTRGDARTTGATTTTQQWYMPQGLYLEMDAMANMQQQQHQEHDNASVASIDSVFSHEGGSVSTATGLMGIPGSNPQPSMQQNHHHHQQQHLNTTTTAATLATLQHQNHMVQGMDQMIQQQHEVQAGGGVHHPTGQPQQQQAGPPGMWEELGSCNSWNNMPGACQVGDYDCRPVNCLGECAIY